MDPIALAKNAGNYSPPDTPVDDTKVLSSGEPAQTFGKPWEIDGDSLASITNNQKPLPKNVQPSSTGAYDFGTVFNKLIGVESGGNNNAVSPKGARGLTQVMPKTGDDPGFGVTPLQNNSAAEYKRFGQDYLQAMLKNFNGNYPQAVAAYNAGPAAVEKAITKGGSNWQAILPNETKNYVRKILG